MARFSTAIAATAVALGAIEADAASNVFQGTLDLRAGYGSNPYLDNSGRGGSGLVGGTLTAGLVSSTALSTTTLTGVADVTQNFKTYGRNENYTASLSRSQQLTSRFGINGGVAVSDTLNPGISYQNSFSSGAIYPIVGTSTPLPVTSGVTTGTASDPALITAVPTVGVPVGVFDASTLDLFTIGQRSRRISGNAGANWTPTARDQFSIGGYASRITYKRFNGDYVNYGGTVSYLRTLNARTRVGVNGGLNYTESDDFPNARSYTANLVVIHQFNSIWNFNGQVGVIIPEGAYSRGSNVSLGFSGTVCGTYPRSTYCFSASRQAAPTGIGGLRTDLQFTASISYALDERTRVNAAATVDHSKGTAFVPRQNFYQASIGASRDLGRRFALGASARYQRRTAGGIYAGGGTGYAATIDFITRFGRLSR